MKKLFTLLALLTCFLGVKAVEVVDYEMDYSTATTWVHGWVNDPLLAHLALEDGALHFSNDEAQANFFDYQGQIHPGIAGLDNDASYTITLRIKGTVAQDIHASFSGSSTPGMIPITTDWADVVMEGCVNDPTATYFANSGSLLIQPGDYVGEFWITYIKITHDEKPSSRPVEWIENITNGDASADWPAWSLEEAEPGININWRGDRSGEICAWSLTMGRNEDNLDGQDGRARPFPADIEEVDGNRAFVVNATQCAIINVGDNPDANSFKWANQFWIQSPKGWKSGTDIKLHFRYKATKAVTAETQIHKQHPSDYLIWHAIGDISFTEEWQDFDGTLSFGDDMAEGWSVAFNLQGKLNSPDEFEPVKFYFDDLSWQNMKLDEGLFVASSNKTTGIEYDFDNPTEFVYDQALDAYVATVGTAGKQDTWVNEIMISTISGNAKAFKGATIKPSGSFIGEGNWGDYTSASQYKISLPAAGVWTISVDMEGKQINIVELEGEKPKEPVDIVTNATEIVVKGVDREDLKDEWNNNTNEVSVREEADPGDNPDDAHGLGGDGHNGQTWDNQFFIKANRALEKGEATVLKFKYKASKEAKATTQCHGETPGSYMHWAAIGDVNFTTDWQPFENEFTVPDAADGMWCIAFNLAEIKEACDYEITEVQWYLKNDEEGKTMENLIDATGSKNFYVKIGAGTDPYVYGGEDGINGIVTKNNNASNAIFNIAGQKVDENYKGLVIKSGKKLIQK